MHNRYTTEWSSRPRLHFQRRHAAPQLRGRGHCRQRRSAPSPRACSTTARTSSRNWPGALLRGPLSGSSAPSTAGEYSTPKWPHSFAWFPTRPTEAFGLGNHRPRRLCPWARSAPPSGRSTAAASATRSTARPIPARRGRTCTATPLEFNDGSSFTAEQMTDPISFGNYVHESLNLPGLQDRQGLWPADARADPQRAADPGRHRLPDVLERRQTPARRDARRSTACGRCTCRCGSAGHQPRHPPPPHPQPRLEKPPVKK